MNNIERNQLIVNRIAYLSEILGALKQSGKHMDNESATAIMACYIKDLKSLL